jgi:hypothetical protein
MTTLQRIGYESARIATLLAIGLLIALYVANLALSPAFAPAVAETWTPNITWSPVATRAAITQLGWLPTTPVFFFLMMQALVGATTFVVALLILARKHRTGYGLFIAFVLTMTGYSAGSQEQLRLVVPALSGLLDFLGVIGWQLSCVWLYVFPDGRFVPRWTAWLLVAWAAVNLLGYERVGILIPSLLVLSAIVSPIYRYFWRADATSRQQVKWVVFGLIVTGLFLPFGMLPFVAPDLFNKSTGEGLAWSIAVRSVTLATGLAIPLSIAAAILRQRLWDIDIILRRTVTYALVSGALALIYFGANIVAQGVIGALGGQRNEVAIVASTLAVAALFSPIRRRVQNAIDRRFNRQRYDADKVVADFAEYAARETDLAALQARIVGVVAETIQPRQVTMWVRETADSGLHQAGK